MRLVEITENKVEVNDPHFGGKTLHRGFVYLVHDLLLEGILNQNWGKVVGNENDLRHLPQEILTPGNNSTRVLFIFHGGFGDAISVTILLHLIEKKYNLHIDISCNHDVWHYVLKPMGFSGKRLTFPIEIETIDEYDYIQTDVTNFIPDQTRRWERCIMEELAQAYRIDIAQCHGYYSIPNDILQRIKVTNNKKVRIGVNFESKGAIRNYPNGLAHQLISTMIETGFEVYRFGTQRLNDGYVFPIHGYYDYSGRTTTFELAALTKQMDMVIGIDSFPVHLANILGVRTIALLSTTKPGIFRWHKNVVCMASEIDCSPCGRVADECPQGYENCKAFYHDSVSLEQIMAHVIYECKNLFLAVI
ncbi:MAG: hypothetical protein D4R45_06480 [Planctomycetaceae bacterium]|nr:MAG: hypothetical protein D4R45_06480 [Planctomycetaceae bacterium]